MNIFDHGFPIAQVTRESACPTAKSMWFSCSTHIDLLLLLLFSEIYPESWARIMHTTLMNFECDLIEVQ